MIITQEHITAGLRDLGLRKDSKVLVHSAMSSFGHVEGGADTIIDALLQTVGDNGTLLVPTLTGSEELSPANPPIFDPANTPCWTGRIPETLRARPDAIRSLHATHSVAAIGADAEALARRHLESVAPCDEDSPYGLLAGMTDGYILLIGVNHQNNTTFHHIEEVAGLDYHLQPDFAKATIITANGPVERHILLHAYGNPRNFSVMEPLFIERRIQKTGQIGNALVRLIHAGAMVDLTLKCVRGNPRLLCE